VRSGPGAARTILLSHIISARPSKQPLVVRTFLKVYMELGSYFLFLQEQIKDIIIIRNMKALGGLDSKWDPIRKKLVRRLLEEQGMRQGKVLRSYFAQKGGARSKGGGRCNFKGREHVHCRSFHRCCRRRSESSSSSLFVFPFSSVASVLHSPVACACTTSHGAWCSGLSS
jgi:hypothetical protein